MGRNSSKKSEKTKCHAYVKKQIERTKILSDYSELEAYRVDVDYELSKRIKYNHYRDALRIQQRILNKIEEPEYVPYDEDKEYFFKHRKS